MQEYNALTFNNIPEEDKVWIKIIVGGTYYERLRYVEDINPRATEKEKEWYSKLLLQVINIK